MLTLDRVYQETAEILTRLVALGVLLQSADKVVEIFLLLLTFLERPSLKFRIVSLWVGVSFLASIGCFFGSGVLRKAPPQ